MNNASQYLQVALTRNALFTAGKFLRYPLDTTLGTFTMTLPSNPNNSDVVAAKWVLGAAAPTVQGQGGTLIDGSATYTYTILYQDVVFQWSSGLNAWMAT